MRARTHKYLYHDTSIMNTLQQNTRRVYALYNEADRLPETNGSLSLNLRPSGCHAIDALLSLNRDSRVFWGGCGTGPEVISMAMTYPSVKFVAVDMNESAIDVANRILESLRQSGECLSNIEVRIGDIKKEDRHDYTHVYSTAVAGAALYAHLRYLAEDRVLCMLKRPMWQGEHNGRTRYVSLSGSGERRQLMSKRM